MDPIKDMSDVYIPWIPLKLGTYARCIKRDWKLFILRNALTL